MVRCGLEITHGLTQWMEPGSPWVSAEDLGYLYCIDTENGRDRDFYNYGNLFSSLSQRVIKSTSRSQVFAFVYLPPDCAAKPPCPRCSCCNNVLATPHPQDNGHGPLRGLQRLRQPHPFEDSAKPDCWHPSKREGQKHLHG